MCHVDIVTAETNKLNIPMRKSINGPEIEIVKQFLNVYKDMATRSSWKHDVVIFVEPKLDTGYPDLLIAHYDSKKIKEWVELRGSLSDRDLKILALLMNEGAMDSSLVSHISGFSVRRVQNSLKSLSDCGLALRLGERWVAAKKTTFFSLERLVSVEAKTCNALEALDQAFRNTGFSSLSYSLLGNEKMTKRMRNRYEALGVGAIAGESFNEVVCPKKRNVPICYTTLLVNEWITKRAAMEALPC